MDVSKSQDRLSLEHEARTELGALEEEKRRLFEEREKSIYDIGWEFANRLGVAGPTEECKNWIESIYEGIVLYDCPPFLATKSYNWSELGGLAKRIGKPVQYNTYKYRQGIELPEAGYFDADGNIVDRLGLGSYPEITKEAFVKALEGIAEEYLNFELQKIEMQIRWVLENIEGLKK
jgi:hypothetical protein